MQSCRPRVSSLRCAYCHDELGGARSWSCERCSSRLHQECRELALTCPSLGCRPSLKARARAIGATLGDLAAWLVIFAGIWASLLWLLPRITKIFEKRRVLPVPTEALLTLVRFAHSEVGVMTGVLVVGLSVFVFVKFRERAATRHALTAFTLAGFAFLPFAGLAVLLPLATMARV